MNGPSRTIWTAAGSGAPPAFGRERSNAGESSFRRHLGNALSRFARRSSLHPLGKAETRRRREASLGKSLATGVRRAIVRAPSSVRKRRRRCALPAQAMTSVVYPGVKELLIRWSLERGWPGPFKSTPSNPRSARQGIPRSARRIPRPSVCPCAVPARLFQAPRRERKCR